VTVNANGDPEAGTEAGETVAPAGTPASVYRVGVPPLDGVNLTLIQPGPEAAAGAPGGRGGAA
jgi:hypothetical protein